jgi:hypothetical protein
LNPFAAWRFLTEAQTVMLRRSLALLAEPHQAGPALARMAVEKHIAFSEGAAAAGLAIARGATPEAVMAAAIRPARQRVRRNVKGKGLA